MNEEKTPWRVDKGIIQDAENVPVFSFYEMHDDHIEKCDRIVACVNACVSLSNDELSAGNIASIIANLKQETMNLQAKVSMQEEILEEVKTQRNSLQAEIKLLKDPNG